MIVLVAVILRAGAALYMGDRVYDLPGIFDQISYDGLAQRVVAGHGFSFGTDWWPATRAGEPTAHWSFSMTLYLAAIYKLFGYHPLVARLIQAVAAGILMPLLTFRLAAKVSGRAVALLAAAISAVYIYFFYYAAALMTETFYFLAVLASLNLAVTLARQPVAEGRSAWGRWISFGLAVGCAVLFRQTFLLFVPFMLLWILWAGRGRIRWMQLAIPLAVIGLMILPWTVRNYLAFHQFVLLNTNAGYVFFWSNHPIQGTSFISLLGTEQPNYHALIPPELLSLDEASLEKALMARGLGFVTADPGRYLLLSLSRIKDYFVFWPRPDSSTLSNISRVGSFGVFLPPMIYGLVLSVIYVWRRRSMPAAGERAAALVLLYLFMLVYSGIHILTWAGIRYRLPIDTVLVVFAAIGLYDLYARLAPHGARPGLRRLTPDRWNLMTSGDLPKRFLDLALSTPLLILISPLLLLLAVMVRLDSPGPVVYRRRVMGRGGAQFDAFKFRTMRLDGDAILAQRPELLAELQRDQKLRNDPRVTPVGRWLRRLSLDELPQLVNVLRGEMSLVGPRMIIRSELSRYGDGAVELLSVRPGMTGLWQVSGRGDVQGEARARIELEYVRIRSLWLDLRLLLLTVPALLRGRGAY